MFILCKCLSKTVSALALSIIMMTLSGAWNPAWSAPDAAASTDQQSPAAPTDPSSGPAKAGAGNGHHAMRKACAQDAQRLCPDVHAGKGRIAQCLKQHVPELSQGCSEMMQQPAKGRQ